MRKWWQAFYLTYTHSVVYVTILETLKQAVYNAEFFIETPPDPQCSRETKLMTVLRESKWQKSIYKGISEKPIAEGILLNIDWKVIL